MKLKRKLAQEEMVGFALIIIIVSVILIIFLGITLNKSDKETVESYEVESFIQSALQYNTNCSTYRESFTSIQRLIMECNSKSNCLDGQSACAVLENTLGAIVEESWKVDANRPLKGYQLSIKSDGADLLVLEKGNMTNNYKGAMQDFNKDGFLIEVFFTSYY